MDVKLNLGSLYSTPPQHHTLCLCVCVCVLSKGREHLAALMLYKLCHLSVCIVDKDLGKSFALLFKISLSSLAKGDLLEDGGSSVYMSWKIVICGMVIVLPDVQIPRREERRLPRQCNSQKGKFITDSSQGFLPQPTQWCLVRKSLEQRLSPKFIRYA